MAKRTFRLIAGALAVATGALTTSAVSAEPIVPVSTNMACDPLDASVCMFPFPNDYFTIANESTATGKLVNFSPLAMPRNGVEVTEGGEGKPVDVTEWNRNDGFSPGSAVTTYVPGIDLHVTWGTQNRAHSDVAPNEPGYFDYRDHIADIGIYKRPLAPIVIIDAATGRRHPFWSEVDTHPEAVTAAEQALILRPARNFLEGHRYIVAMRNLKDAQGAVIPAGDAFAAYRDGAGDDETRQQHFDESIFPVLGRAGIARDNLYLAWDFTIASERNLSERILHIRDEAFAQLGDSNLADRRVSGTSPEFTIDSFEDVDETWTSSRGLERTGRYRIVLGRVTVPNYMDRVQQTEGHVQGNELPYDVPVPGSRFMDSDGDGMPDQNPIESTLRVPFICHVPLNGRPNYGTLYGHGLLGTKDQIGDVQWPRRHGFFGCGADWWGMSTPDAPTVVAILADFSAFPSLPDRAQQGFLNFMFLGRAAVHPEGFAAEEAFQMNGKPLVRAATPKKTWLFFDGNSQGAIMGGSLVAVSPDIHRGILGVPGMNYSTLLTRSVDWEGSYAVAYYATYQDPLERVLGFSLLQMLWDRGESNGYAQHMTWDPLPNTPKHQIMLQVAYSDHQVTNHSAEVEARTIGARLLLPGLAKKRHWEMNPYFTPTARYPYRGSGLIYWDSGNAIPPNGNIPPADGDDPHGHPRDEPAGGWQEAQFLLTGWMVNVCGKGPYLTLRNVINDGVASCHEPFWKVGSRLH